MRFSQYLPIGAWLSATAVARSAWVPRATSTSIGELYAYGTGINGLPLFTVDSVVYVGDQSLMSSSKNVTFSLSDTTIEVTSTGNSTSTAALAVDTTSGAYEDVIVTTSATGGYTTTGFVLFGAQVALLQSTGLDANFAAVPGTVDGVWELKWYTDNGLEDSTSNVLVNIKNIAPAL